MSGIILPLRAPLYSTYHHQGIDGAVIASNPSIQYYRLNNTLLLVCNRKFLNGFTSPELTIDRSSFVDNPYIKVEKIDLRHTHSFLHLIIKNLLDDGLYVAFDNVDDYYLPEKSWYKTRHFFHDGLIFGYNEDKKVYYVYAYDSNWVYRTIEIPFEAFREGVLSAVNEQRKPRLFGLEVLNENAALDKATMFQNLKRYMDEENQNDQEHIYGTLVHDYLVLYLKKLRDLDIAHDRMDWRVMRVIAEHKKAMLHRIVFLAKGESYSEQVYDRYEAIVKISEKHRFLYASYQLKRRIELLDVIMEELVWIKNEELDILHTLLNA